MSGTKHVLDMDSPPVESQQCPKTSSSTPTSDNHAFTCLCENCMPLADDDTLNEIVIEEDSVEGNVG
jgi:hypothetical protein